MVQAGTPAGLQTVVRNFSYGLALNKYKEMVDAIMWSNGQVNLKDCLKEVHISFSLSANILKILPVFAYSRHVEVTGTLQQSTIHRHVA